MSGKWKILFICTHNSARSHMAEGLVNAFYQDRFRAFSAGTEPSAVNPLAVRVMQEIGIDISGHRSKSVDEFLDQDLDYVVTVCDHAKETCPFFPGGRKPMHKGFLDPSSATGTEEENWMISANPPFPFPPFPRFRFCFLLFSSPRLNILRLWIYCPGEPPSIRLQGLRPL